ncbi:hypothetical protein Tco_0425716 [Tanacetum coccineum]
MRGWGGGYGSGADWYVRWGWVGFGRGRVEIWWGGSGYVRLRAWVQSDREWNGRGIGLLFLWLLGVGVGGRVEIIVMSLSGGNRGVGLMSGGEGARLARFGLLGGDTKCGSGIRARRVWLKWRESEDGYALGFCGVIVFGEEFVNEVSRGKVRWGLIEDVKSVVRKVAVGGTVMGWEWIGWEFDTVFLGKWESECMRGGGALVAGDGVSVDGAEVCHGKRVGTGELALVLLLSEVCALELIQYIWNDLGRCGCGLSAILYWRFGSFVERCMDKGMVVWEAKWVWRVVRGSGKGSASSGVGKGFEVGDVNRMPQRGKVDLRGIWGRIWDARAGGGESDGLWSLEVCRLERGMGRSEEAGKEESVE